MRTPAEGIGPVSVQDVKQCGEYQAALGRFRLMLQKKSARNQNLAQGFSVEICGQSPVEMDSVSTLLVTGIWRSSCDVTFECFQKGLAQTAIRSPQLCASDADGRRTDIKRPRLPPRQRRF